MGIRGLHRVRLGVAQGGITKPIQEDQDAGAQTQPRSRPLLRFRRGETPIEPFFHQFGPQPVPNNPHPNPTLHPLAETAPPDAILLVAGTLDTKGGPCIDSHARVLDVRNRPIPGLYGAGNCVASPTGPAYWAGGATLGPAITFGARAAEHALRRAAAEPPA